MKVSLPDFYEQHARAFLEETASVRLHVQIDANGSTPEGRARIEKARLLAAIEHAIAHALGTTSTTPETTK